MEKCSQPIELINAGGDHEARVIASMKSCRGLAVKVEFPTGGSVASQAKSSEPNPFSKSKT
jgi:hypothetical protein